MDFLCSLDMEAIKLIAVQRLLTNSVTHLCLVDSLPSIALTGEFIKNFLSAFFISFAHYMHSKLKAIYI